MKLNVFTFGAALVMATGWAGAPAGAAELDSLKQQLTDADDEKAADAAKKLGESGDAKAIDVILDALAVGAPPHVQAVLLGDLAGKKDARAVEVLKHYTRNRNPELRKKAVIALAELADARAVPALIAALSDPVEDVRGAAALALGKRKERSAIEPLVKLLEHKDAAAATALAQLATPELAHRMAEMIGRVPDALLCSALGEMLKRPDFGPEPIRVEVVKTLSKVPGIDSTSVLIEYVAATEKDKMRPSRVEAQKIVDQRSGQ
ncbi:MAG TPA: HEAT repeat domain-containing protein [Polyangia bacterium]|nr:HEAT repeat domain-containing protein [Polyangia bacterium]